MEKIKIDGIEYYKNKIDDIRATPRDFTPVQIAITWTALFCFYLFLFLVIYK